MTCEMALDNAIIRLWAAIAWLALVAGVVATLTAGQ
jgi:hypothetical protein